MSRPCRHSQEMFILAVEMWITFFRPSRRSSILDGQDNLMNELTPRYVQAIPTHSQVPAVGRRVLEPGAEASSRCRLPGLAACLAWDAMSVGVL
jgi:hypothetical protein